MNNEIQPFLCSEEVRSAMQNVGADLHLLAYRQELTQELAAAWFLENFDIDIHARRLFEKGEDCFIWEARIDCLHLEGKSYADSIQDETFKSKEEAMNVGLLKACSLIPQ